MRSSPARGQPCFGRRLAASALALAVAICAGLWPSTALAWVEAHVEADDTRVSIDKGGKAHVEHRITLRIAGGPLRSLDLRGVDDDAVPDADAFVVPEKEAHAGSIASATPAGVELAPKEAPRGDKAPAPPALRIRFQGKGLTRGTYVLRVRYATDLGSRIDASGRLAHIAWSGLTWDDGLDSLRVTFDLPSAPNAPRAEQRAVKEGEAAPPLVLSSVRRGPLRDEIELVRPYTPRGDVPHFAIEADALALSAPAAPPPAKKPVVAAVAERFGGAAERPLRLGIAGALAFFFAALVVRKSLEVKRTSAAAATTARPLVPLPAWVRAPLAGAALASGVALQMLLSRPTEGAALVALAAALAAHRTPRARLGKNLRARGRWYPLEIEKAFAPVPGPSGVWLDVSTVTGKVLLLLAFAALVALVQLVFEVSPFRAELLALDGVTLLAIFGTGRITELPLDPVDAARPFLTRVAERLEKTSKKRPLRLFARVRMPDAAPSPDELRLLVAPKLPLEGFVALEIGVVVAHGAGGGVIFPEVLLRVNEASACDVEASRFGAAARTSRGRKRGERVLSFRPRWPSARMTADLAARLAIAVASAQASRPRVSARPSPVRRAA